MYILFLVVAKFLITIFFTPFLVEVSVVHEIEMKKSEVKKGRSRPKSNVGLASRAMNYAQITSHFSDSNQGISYIVYADNVSSSL